jgi:hypothetical protein
MGCAYALFTKTSTSFHSSGRFPTNPSTALTSLTSNLTGSTFTPFAKPSISFATSLSVSSRLAVKMSFRSSGCVRANSTAVERPMPEDAPVITIVLPLRRWAMLEDILVAERRWASGVVSLVGLRGRIEGRMRAVEVWIARVNGRRRCMYVF